MSEPEKCSLVTGASGGIGSAIVELLVARGRRVLACGRDAAALQRLADRFPRAVTTLARDLAQPDSGAALVHEAERAFGRLDELVYAAGAVEYAAIRDTTVTALRRQLEVNFVAPFSIMQRVAERMAEQQAGAMVVVASTLADSVAPSTAAYAASKAALVSAVRSFALELAPHVRVNAVAPGLVDTPMIRVPRRALAADEQCDAVVESQLAELRALHPLGRLGTPQDVADAVLYLLDARWVTGTILTVDGGLTLR